MNLLKIETIKKTKVYIYVSGSGMFVAYSREQSPDNPDPQEIIDSADTLHVLMERLQKKVTRASRIKLAIPFLELDRKQSRLGSQDPTTYEFRPHIVTGRHQGTGHWMVYDVQRDRTTQESLSYGAYYPPDLPQEERERYFRLVAAQNKINRLLNKWHEKNRINLQADALKAWQEAQDAQNEQQAHQSTHHPTS